MTVYSQHPSRGKVQILATYQGPSGVVSTTVTSVDDSAVAAPIVDALNRISACAAAPVTAYDTRTGDFDNYPCEHLAALTDLGARASLLEGDHSLWYEYDRWLLHHALTDLDVALAQVPAAVRTALTAELEAEGRWLRRASAESSEDVTPSETADRREWDSEHPLVTYKRHGLEKLADEDRGYLNRLEEASTDDQRRAMIEGMRLLLDGYVRSGQAGMLMLDELSIGHTRDELDGYSFDLKAPVPDGDVDSDKWSLDILLWEQDGPDGSIGSTVLKAIWTTPPTVSEIVTLLSTADAQPLAEWAQTPVGKPLAGTTFVVTELYED